MQSSTSGRAGAERATDGNKDNVCTQTKKTNSPWWRVNLNGTYAVSAVRISTRRDCCSEWLLGAEIRIGNSLNNNGNSNRRCGTVHSVSATTLTFSCGGFTGRYVNIIVPGPGRILTLCEVQVSGSKLPSLEGAANVALGASAVQSSTFRQGAAQRAIDGKSSSVWRQGSCTHTKRSKDPWWRVDLKGIYNVSVVRITNRRDCCSKRLQGAEIRIGNSLYNEGNSNSLCGIIHADSGLKFTFGCVGFTGRFVNIIIRGRSNILTLCEVEVFGSEIPSLEHPGNNVALGSRTMQSSTSGRAGAERATDGNKDNVCTQTKKSNGPWWRVDLNETYAVSAIRISTRRDCCSEWLLGAEIRIGNSLNNNGNSNRLCGTVHAVSAKTLSFNCGGFTGRYVNIINPGRDKILTLCEVQVFGSKLPSLEGAANVALGSSAMQSSTYQRGAAQRAVDGKSSSVWRQRSCTHTKRSQDPWWRVDLKRIYNMSIVRITNRRDCCSKRLQGAEIRIGNSLYNEGNSNRLCGTVHADSGNKFTFSCVGFTGRFVNIIIPGRSKILTLCEVEVFGSELPSMEHEGFKIRPSETTSASAGLLEPTRRSALLRAPKATAVHVQDKTSGGSRIPGSTYSGTNIPVISGSNVALGSMSTQSSTSGRAGAERATDGNKDNRCTKTKKSNSPWWRVDLNETYAVSVVQISTRRDCCSEWLFGAEIRIGNSLNNSGNSNRLCGAVQSVPATAHTFNCDGLMGRYVNIITPGPGRILILCEVQVFGSKLSSLEDAGGNVALRATATQSSTFGCLAAERATDGNADDSCTQTTRTIDPWWRVDLHDTYAVSVVRISNRRDCCSEWLLGAEIRIGNSLNNSGNSNILCGMVECVAEVTFNISCGGIWGRYVNIIIPGRGNILTLCEVEVFGSKVLSGNTLSGTAIEPIGSYQREGAEGFIDGNANNILRRGSCMRTKRTNDPWVRIDLKGPYAVTVVRIFNKNNCCSEQLQGAEIHIGNSLENDGNLNRLCGTIQSNFSTELTFKCDGFWGRYVDIVLPGRDKILTLCDVEIFGAKLPTSEASENMALRGIAQQTSTYYRAGAHRAIDGNGNNTWLQGSCTSTKRTKNPWWRVDLKSISAVSEVRIINRVDCCSDWLHGAEIRIGNSLENYGNSNALCGIVRSVSGEKFIFRCEGYSGRYVNIIIPGHGKVLTICEVEVYGWKVQMREQN